MLLFVFTNYMAPAVASALRAVELLQPFVADHQHWVSIDHQSRPLVAHAPGFELFEIEYMQEILFAVTGYLLGRMGWTE